MKKILFLFIQSFVLTLTALPQANVLNPLKIINEENANSTVLLYKLGPNGILINHGTAFSLYNYLGKKDILITCEHVTRNSLLIASIPATDSARIFFRA